MLSYALNVAIDLPIGAVEPIISPGSSKLPSILSSKHVL